MVDQGRRGPEAPVYRRVCNLADILVDGFRVIQV